MAGKPKSKVEAGKRKPEKKKKSNAGAKSKYDSTFPLLVESYARKGMTDKAISAALGISQDTFYKYIKEYPEFSEGLTAGRRPHVIEVENSMLMSAKGYYKENKKTEKVKGADGKWHVKEIIENKWYPPSFNAGAFWLTNKAADDWKYKREEEGNDEDYKEQLIEYLSALLNKQQ